MSGNTQYNLEQSYMSNKLHVLKVTHKDFSKLHQDMLYMAYKSKKVHKQMRGLLFLFGVNNFKIETENDKVVSILYNIEQKMEYENIKKKDKLFWEMTPFHHILNV